ncbi:MAG: helix-turn-helix domain-containing protein [Chloroflexota bacterium]
MSRFRRSTGPNSDWITLGEATRILGVSAGTLRRWSDAGRLSVFVTPGGHRRFNRPALQRLLPSDRPTRLSLVRSALTPARLARAYRREASAAARQLPWLVDLTDDQRQWFRIHGRRMAELLLGHLDGEQGVAATQQLKAAVAEAVSYGRMAAQLRLSLSQALEGFLQFRRPFLHELSVAAQRRGIDPGGTTALMETAERALDQLLVAAITAQGAARIGAARGRARSTLLAEGAVLAPRDSQDR